VQGDRAAADAELRPLRDDSPMTDAELEEFVSRLSGRLGFAREQVGQAPRGLRTRIGPLVKDATRVRAARDRLLLPGAPGDLLKGLPALQAMSFPPLQVVLLDERQAYDARRDERMKLLGLAPWQIDALPADEKPAPYGAGLFDDLLPRVVEIRREQGRLEQRIALLRHVEALRLFAADHGGKLPEKLSDVALPLPADPFTGKPFEYRPEGSVAHLRGGAPRGEEKNPAFGPRYEVTVRK